MVTEPPIDLSKVRHVVGRDFGGRTTCALSVVAIPEGSLTQERLDLATRIVGLAKSDGEIAKTIARTYLEAHVSPLEPVEQVMHYGRKPRPTSVTVAARDLSCG